ncbi:hypothetical protein LOTGIDRAFT_162609 [Lottia gigantea]|uniref:DNA-directed DNA polymerase n=1 Tax=Lottia gigantea TaxID=225164 RepID=V4AFX6_LOTGI|nr:hypothetical protein LOTGIDRAFT_162609 [Lottia gigantea]ESO92306.1 hypothetical protein LOTGIDRAFT_162609 [Lottia gigantea]
MANKFGLGSLPLESKNPMSSTAFINKAKPFFVDQIGDTLQGDIDMNNFKITNLKFPGNDNDAVNKKYLLDQINAIQIDKDPVENRIYDVKRFIRRNIKNLVDEPKLQQELTSLKRLIQVDKTSQLQNLISKLEDKITKVKIDVQRLIDNSNVNEDRLKRKLTALERKLGELLAELDKTADKTEVQNSISNLNEKIAKQKSDVQDIINTLPIDKDTLKRQLSALDTKITDELEKEVGVIKNFLQNKFRDDMKNYIKEQVNLLVSRIHDDFLRQERKLSKLEAIVTDKSYYFNLPFERKIILMKDNFQEIKRSRVGRGGTDLLKKINEYEGENCYIPTDGHCFIKCVNRVLNEDYTREFQEYINGFSKANRKGVMTCARMKEFNTKFNTSFQIYNPKNRHFHPRDVHDELDWVFYLHNLHFCLIRRSQKSLGVEQVWKTCRDAVTQVSPLKLNVLSSMSDDALLAWDCETYSEKDTRRAIPYACTLINLEKLRKMLNRINNLFPDLKSSDPIPEEFYDKLMNVVEIFVGTDCIDQMLKYLGQYDRKRLILISHNGSGFDNWIVLKNTKKLTHCPLKTPRGILSFPYTDEDLQKKWKRQKEIKGNYLQHINFTCSYQHESSSLAAWGNSSNLPANLRKIADVDIAKYTQDNWEELRHEWEPYAKRDTLCLGACLIKYNQVTKEVVNQNMSNNLTAPSLSGWYYLYHYD